MLHRLMRMLGVLLALVLLAAPVAAQTTSTPEDAPMLQGSESVSGTLSGSSSGNFAYYKVSYPGGDGLVTFRMQHFGLSHGERNYAGMNVYAENGTLLGRGQPVEEPNTLELAVANDVAETWLVQVYNYAPDQAIVYYLTVSGLPQDSVVPRPEESTAEASEMLPSGVQPSSIPTPQSSPTTTVQAMQPTPTPTPVGGMATVEAGSSPETAPVIQGPEAISAELRGNSAGSFNYYKVIYPGDSGLVEFRLQTYGLTFGEGEYAGLNVYAEDGMLLGEAQAVEEANTYELAVANDVAETWLVQIYNYAPDKTIVYYLTVSGIPTDTTVPRPENEVPVTDQEAPGQAVPAQLPSPTPTGS